MEGLQEEFQLENLNFLFVAPDGIQSNSLVALIKGFAFLSDVTCPLHIAG